LYIINSLSSLVVSMCVCHAETIINTYLLASYPSTHRQSQYNSSPFNHVFVLSQRYHKHNVACFVKRWIHSAIIMANIFSLQQL